MKKSLLSLFALAANVALLSVAFAHDGAHNAVPQPNAHAPIGVSGDHLHKQGTFMIGYKFDRTSYGGLQDGSNFVSYSDGLGHHGYNYGEGHKDMTMDMHMFEIMWGVTDNLTLMVMPQYMQMDMTHISLHGGGHSHPHKVSGWGDTQVMALYGLVDTQSGGARHKVHANVGVSVPTESIDKMFANHHDELYPNPYTMNLGTGTFDPIVGFTYNGTAGEWGWGFQNLNEIRVYDNDNGWRAGNKYNANAWVSRNLNDYVSLSARLEGEIKENTNGFDARLPFNTVIGANPDTNGYRRLDAAIGANFLIPQVNARFAVEFVMPLYLHANGLQNERDYRVIAGFQYGF